MMKTYAFWLLLADVFLMHSRILNMLAPNLHIMLVLFIALGALFLATRQIFGFWGNWAGRLLLVWSAWLGVATWFGISRHDSQAYMQQFVVGAGLFIVAAGLLTTTDRIQQLYWTLAASGFVAAAMGLFWGTHEYGRLELRGGNYLDPNEYATGLLMTLPFFGTLAAVVQERWQKLLLGFANLLPFVMMLRTGSRGALAAFAVALVVVFVLSSLTVRIVLAVGAAVVVVGALAFMPDSVRSRFAPDSMTETATLDRSGADSQSLEARQTLFFTSLAMTLNNPLSGVGPGNFANAVVEEGKMQGQEWAPLNTHNTYTQVASETGFPGLLLYISLVGLGFFNVISALRDTRPKGGAPNPQAYRLGKGLLISMAAFFAALGFINHAYSPLPYLWLGMTVALRQLVARPQEEMADEATNKAVEAES